MEVESRYLGFSYLPFEIDGEADYLASLVSLMAGREETRMWARVMCFFFFVKSVLTIPLYFWPVFRELEVLFSLTEDPSMELETPQFLQMRQRKWVATRILLYM